MTNLAISLKENDIIVEIPLDKDKEKNFTLHQDQGNQRLSKSYMIDANSQGDQCRKKSEAEEEMK